MKKYIFTVFIFLLIMPFGYSQDCEMYIDKSILTEEYKDEINKKEETINNLLKDLRQTRLVSGKHPDTYVVVFYKENRDVLSGNWYKIIILKNYILNYELLIIQNQRLLISKKQECFKKINNESD